MCKRILPLLCGILLLLAPQIAWSGDGEIILTFDATGSKCSENIDCAQNVTLFVYAVLEGASAGGITSAEYGIRIGVNGAPDNGWVFQEQFNADATIVLGDAFSPLDQRARMQPRYRKRGVNVAFPMCNVGDGEKVLLEAVEIYNVGCDVNPLSLLVIAHDNASSQFFQCPLFTLCDAPVFTKVCLGTNLRECRNPMPPFAVDATCSTSGGAVVNPQPNQSSPCPTTAVESSTWSYVKGLYHD